MGSSLGLYNFLKSKGHSVKVIVPSDYPEFLFWMPGHEDVEIFNSDDAFQVECILKADVLFCCLKRQ